MRGGGFWVVRNMRDLTDMEVRSETVDVDRDADGRKMLGEIRELMRTLGGGGHGMG